MTTTHETWPALPLERWRDTCAAIHLWTQMLGKIRLAQTPWINHSWHVTLYVTATGLTTGPIAQGTRIFQIDLDFIDHGLKIQCADGRAAAFQLQPRSMATFYRQLAQEMQKVDLAMKINPTPSEIADAIPFDRDEAQRPYDPDYANRFWRALLQAQRVFTIFRARFIGKCSPVHFFWGAPDLAVTRFSGRRAPEHPGGVPNLPDRVTREAYSHEVSSCGFWPGGGAVPYAAFYSYAYPEPRGFAESPVSPAGAFYSPELREFILPYDDVRSADAPDDLLMSFLQSTYETAATLAGWDRAALERTAGRGQP